MAQSLATAQGQLGPQQRPREDFPATSIGRSTHSSRMLFQPQLQRQGSNSSISTSASAHPLQSPPPASTSHPQSTAPTFEGVTTTELASATTALNVPPDIMPGVRSRSPSPVPSTSPSYSHSHSHSPVPTPSPSHSRSASPNPHSQYPVQSQLEDTTTNSAGGTTLPAITPLGIPLSSNNMERTASPVSGISSSRPNMPNNASAYNSQRPYQTLTPSSSSSTPPIPAPRYVPYTPRHRGGVATGAMTASVGQYVPHYQPPYQKLYQYSQQQPIVQQLAMPQAQQSYPPPSGTPAPPSQPQPHPYHGDATSKLQFMSLKAAAQRMSLDTGTIGWAILEKLVLEGGAGGSNGPTAGNTTTDVYGSPGEWAELWSLVTSGKATLLLPVESIATSDRITIDFVRDHIMLCDTSSESNTPIVTLSGLRGKVYEDQLILRSTINTSSKAFQDLLSPTTRAYAFEHLPPLPKIPIYPNSSSQSRPPSVHRSSTNDSVKAASTPSTSNSSESITSARTSTPSLTITRSSTPSQSYACAYPNFSVESRTSTLPFPPKISPNSKPPLPPRPGFASGLGNLISPSTSSASSISSSPSTLSLSSNSSASAVSTPATSTVAPSPISLQSPQPMVRTSSNSSDTSVTNARAKIMSPFVSLFGHRHPYAPSPSPSPAPSSASAPVTPVSTTPSTGVPATSQHTHHLYHHQAHSPSPTPGGHPAVPSISTVIASGHSSTYTASSAVDPPVVNAATASAEGTGGATQSEGGSNSEVAGLGPTASAGKRTSSGVAGTIDVSAFVIDRKIVRRDVGKQMNKALRAEVKEKLTSTPLSSINSHMPSQKHGHSRRNSKDKMSADEEQVEIVNVPTWVVDRVHEFTAEWYPVLRNTTVGPGLGPGRQNQPLTVPNVNANKGRFGFLTSSSGAAGANGGPNAIGDAVLVNALKEQSLDDVSRRLQEFYSWLMEDALKIGRSPFAKNRLERHGSGHGQDASDSSTSSHGKGSGSDEDLNEDENEIRVRQILEVVERTVSELFYDRFFMQSSSDDLDHDEAVSSRVTVLNALDLGLGNLDVVVEDGMEAEVEVVVRACGEMLTQLEACHNPADKMAILVAAHKIMVDGLSRLPPVRLRTEEESQAAKLKRRQSQEHLKAAENSTSSEKPEEKVTTSSTDDASIAASEPQTGSETLKDEKDENDENSAALETEGADAPESGVDGETAGADDFKKSSARRKSISASSTASTIKASHLDISDDESINETTEPTAAADTKDAPPTTTRLQVPKPNTLISPIVSRSSATPVSGDVLLPMIIFSVVKCDPSHLVSNLLFTQRFRCLSNVGGEETYCLINLLAVAEFLEHVDLEGLGLDGSDKLLSANLNPVPSSTRSTEAGQSPTPNVTVGPASYRNLTSGLRGRVEQQVDALAGSANKVITGVVDSSFGILRSFLPGSDTSAAPSPAIGSASLPTTIPGGGVPPSPSTRFGLLRRGDGFSIANIAASLPGVSARGTPPRASSLEEVGQQLVTVSRPGSIRSGSALRLQIDGVDDGGSDGDIPIGVDDGSLLGGYRNEIYRSDDDALSPTGVGVVDEGGNIKGLNSFESMMNEKSKFKKGHAVQPQRRALSDRLSVLSAKSSPPSRPSSLLNQPIRFDTPISSRSGSPAPPSIQLSIPLKLPAPNQHFLDAKADDLKISEVRQLLREYKKLVEAVRAAGGYEE